MAINNFRIELATAYPGAEQVRSTKGRTYRAEIAVNQIRKMAYLKLLSVEDIAREALCAVLARKLYLPVLTPYYVGIDMSNFQGQKAGNNFGIAFGLEEETLPTFRVANEELDIEILKWPDMIACAVFDEWIGNSDRYPKNLLFAGNNHFWMIDHDEALANHLLPTTPVSPQLMQLLARGRAEFDLYQIRRKMLEIIDNYKSVDWDEILDFLQPNQLQGSERHFVRFIKFLKARTNEMYSILTADLGIRQKYLDLEPVLKKGIEIPK